MGKRHPDESKQTARPQPSDTFEPLQEKVEKTTPQREWEIQKVQEQYGLSRELAEKMVDEFSGRV